MEFAVILRLGAQLDWNGSRLPERHNDKAFKK